MSAGIIFILILALLLVIFTLQNTDPVNLSLFFWDLSDVPLALTLIITLIIGFIAALIIFYPRIWKLKAKIKQQQKELDKIAEDTIGKETHPEGTKITGGSDTGFFNEDN